jgi:cytochrome c556
MKHLYKIIFITTSLLVVTLQVNAADHQQKMKHQHGHQMINDERISLNLPPKMKQHQLANMRAHLKAVQEIVGLIAAQDFKQASQITHQQLGMSKRMTKMCNRIDNEGFKALGMAFHKSADELGETLLTEDTAASLRALNQTMNYCVQCHAVYRQ